MEELVKSWWNSFEDVDVFMNQEKGVRRFLSRNDSAVLKHMIPI